MLFFFLALNEVMNIVVYTNALNLLNLLSFTIQGDKITAPVWKSFKVQALL